MGFNLINSIVSGGLFFLCLFTLFIHFHNKQKVLLYYSLFSLGLGLYIFIDSELLNYLIYGLSETSIATINLTFKTILVPILLVVFGYEYLSNIFNVQVETKKYLFITKSIQSVMALIISILLILFGYKWFNNNIVFAFMRLIIILNTIFYIIILTYYIIKKKSMLRRESILTIVGFVLGASELMCCGILKFNFISNSYVIFGVSVILFSYALIIKISSEYIELTELKSSLEQKVVEKTAELHQSNDELKMQRDERANMLLNIAHEIRNPLTVVSLSFSLFIRKWGEGEGARELEEIKKGFDQMLRDVVNITDSEMLKRGRLSYDHSKVVSLDSIEEKCEVFRQAIEAKGLAFIPYVEKGLYMKVDPNALTRIVNNLLRNALNYSNKGGSIIVSLLPEAGSGNRAEFVVQDNGIGMNEEQVKKLFDPDQNLYREKSNRQGLGIGLSLVKYAVDSFGGEIEVHSFPGLGTKISVFLPLYSPAEDEVISSLPDKEFDINYRPSVNDEQDSPVDDSKIDILHVEDKPAVFKHFQQYFKGRYTFHNAPNGREALKMLETLRPAIIISDIMMEEMDGIEFRNELLKKVAHKATPFIFLSARNEPEEIRTLLKEGAADFVQKPITDIAELEVKIEQYIRMSELISEKEKHRIDNYKDEILAKAVKSYGLTETEVVYFNHLINCKSNKDIIDMVCRSKSTVETHISNVLKKIGVNNRAELLNKLFL